MNRRANSDSIPMDLIIEILSRMPAKSIARFRCVSKLWESIICRQDFNELFHTMSSSNPRLLIKVEKIKVGQGPEWSFFSCPMPQNHYGKSSLVVAANFHSKLSAGCSPCYFNYASGLFYFRRISKKCEVRLIRNPSTSTGQYAISKEYEVVRSRAICNPSTGQYAILPPNLRKYCNRDGFLGFDPIGKQFKVLVVNGIDGDEWVCQILTLGTENVRWREITCPYIYYASDRKVICINGVLYYTAFKKICCFNVRSEKFNLLDVDPDVMKHFQKLINYKEKLSGSRLEYGLNGGFPLKLRIWVLEDFEKGEWSTYAYTLSAENTIVKVNYDLSVVGVTASGEIVLAKENAYKPFYVFYFKPETNTLQSVEIQGVGEEEERRYHRVHCFVDHVEDLNFDVLKTTYDKI